jgi:hypothetical protein
VHDSKVVRKVENQNGKRKHQHNNRKTPKFISSKIKTPKIISSKLKTPKFISSKLKTPKFISSKNQNTESKFCQNAKRRTLSKKNI